MSNMRTKNTQKLIKDKSIDALLITNYYNIFYLTDFVSLSKDEREAYVVLTSNSIYLITDARYIDEKLLLNCKKFEVRVLILESNKRLMNQLQNIIVEEKIQRFGFEAESLNFSEYNALKEKLRDMELIPTHGLIGKQRATKDKDEIENITKACNLTDQCLEDVVPTLTVGQTEKEVSNLLKSWMMNNHCEEAFEPIVAVDQNAALPHYNTKTGNGIVKNGSLLLIDFGIMYNNYVSDITRMVSFGKPSAEIVDTYNKLLYAQQQTIKLISSTNELKNLDIFCRKVLKEKGLPNFSHSLGHGVGLEVHEYPRLSSLSDDVIQAGQVFTVEPGIYYEGKWGMRIEDTVYIDENQKPIILTKFPKDLFVIRN